MEKEKTEKRLHRLSSQLDMTTQKLASHPLTQQKWGIIQTTLIYLNHQIRWTSAGPLARMLISMESALIGSDTEKSFLGLVGPTLSTIQNGAAQLMSTSLPPNAMGNMDFIKVFNQLTTLCTAYLVTQILGDKKKLFPPGDPAAAKTAGRLLQELGVIWMLGTQSVEKFYKMVPESLKIDETSQKMIQDIGMLYFMLLVIFLAEGEDQPTEDLLRTFKKPLLRALISIETTVRKAENRHWIEEMKAMSLINQVQVVKRAAEDEDEESLFIAIKDSLEFFNLSHEKLKEDIKHLIKSCFQLSNTFKDIFYQAEKSVTTMNQAA